MLYMAFQSTSYPAGSVGGVPLEAPVAGRAGLEHALLAKLGQQVIPEPALALDQLK